MEIRRAHISDLGDIAVLFNTYRVFYKQASDLHVSKQFIANRIERNESVIFIAILENRTVGFIQLYPLFASTKVSKTWLLNDLYVDPKYRGKHISKALLKKAQEYTIETGAIALNLETGKDNLIGNALYPTMGFEKDRDHNYYSWSHK